MRYSLLAVSLFNYTLFVFALTDPKAESVLAGIISEFMSDAQWQLVVDLDLFTSLFAKQTESLGKNLYANNESYFQHLLNYVEPLKDYDVSSKCLTDISHYLWSAIQYSRLSNEFKEFSHCPSNVERKKLMELQWIFDVFDAMGKVPAGILDGNNLWIGSWSACRRISVRLNRQGQLWSGKYCLASVQPFKRDSPFLPASEALKYQLNQCKTNETKEETETNDDANECFTLIPLVKYGICIPESCTSYDAKKIFELIYQPTQAVSGKSIICDVTVQCNSKFSEESQVPHESKSLTTLFFLVFILILLCFGTLYDYTIQRKLNKPDAAKQNWLIRLFLSFSVYTNGKNILRTDKGDKQIHCLHGMRVCSMFWIILGHTYYYLISSLTVDNLIPSLILFPKKFFNLLIVQAPLAVDSFFYLSGMLTSYLFMEKFTVEAEKGRSIFSPDMWSLFYIHRYFRLTPIYLLVMILDLTFFTYISDGPFWRSLEPNNCRKSWWTNLIYMNNFLMQNIEVCMGWTWYLANDMQFHLFSPILLISLYKLGFWGVIFGIVLVFISSFIHLAIVIFKDYPPAPVLTSKLQIVHKLETYWPDVYIKPYIRCPPYIIGILVGYALHKFTLKPNFKKWIIACGWTISTICGLFSVFGLYNYAVTGDISEWYRVLYVLFGRNSFAISLAWITFACATGYGGAVNAVLGWKAWIPLSRITFCAYLIHPILLQIYYLSRPHPFHFTTFYQMLYLFAVAVVMAYFIAFLLSLAFEVPVSKIESEIVNTITHGLRRKKRSEGAKSIEEFTGQVNPPNEVKNLVKEPNDN